MPRTRQQLTDHLDDLADRLAADDVPVLSGPHDATALRVLAQAVLDAGRAQTAVDDAVAAARRAGHPWSAIAVMLGTSTQAAHHRYHDQVVRTGSR